MFGMNPEAVLFAIQNMAKTIPGFAEETVDLQSDDEQKKMLAEVKEKKLVLRRYKVKGEVFLMALVPSTTPELSE